jgi:hypothetical protein
VGNGEHEFTAFYDATCVRTVACAYAVTGDFGAAEEAYSRAWPRCGVFWLVQSGVGVTYVAAHAGDTVPPDTVTQAVGALLLHNLDAALSQTGTVEATP